MIEYPVFFQRLQKIRSPKFLPDFDRFCCSTEQDYLPAENATFTGFKAAQLRAKAELTLVTASARSSGVVDGEASVETSAAGSRTSSGVHRDVNLTNTALNPGELERRAPVRSSDPSFEVETDCSSGENQTRKQQHDPHRSSNCKQHDESLGHSVPSPSRVDAHPQFSEGDPSSVQQYKKYDRQAVPSPIRLVEHPQFSEGDPSCVQQSNGQPKQLLADFEQPRNHQLGISHIDLNNPQSPFGGGGPPLEHQSFVYSKETVHEHNQDEYENESVNDYYENDSESSTEVESDNMVDNIYRNMLAQFNRKKYISKCDVNSGTNRHGNSCRSSHSNSSANESQDFYETDAQMENEYLNDDGYHTYPVPLSRKECASECAMHYDLS
eukprot:CAMPEP_0194274184 /NCGR_PEP_ID=MMETSP0169-20130528/7331_1 /TAXON_ID=218684 /ORGANISM="Corethron pennatum, Strain L29A3" /LENGTH=381 /DNA_ID=CAMNT_0039017309 /DNA_START=29 /DNA_END=1170 /DNA_ORIENTATION=+